MDFSKMYGWGIHHEIKTYYNIKVKENTFELKDIDIEDARHSENTVRNDYSRWFEDIGGHYYWSWNTLDGAHSQSGHIQMNRSSSCVISGDREGKSDCYQYCPLHFKAKINTGFPYDVKKYQGVAHYTIYAPDSSLVCKKDIQMSLSDDSVMMGHIIVHDIFTVDSAMIGQYRVVVEADYTDKPQTWIVAVADPFAGASSSKPVDATFRLPASDFNESTRKAWTYSGAVTPTYLDKGKVSAMIVNSGETKGNAFRLSQSISKMPKGVYKINWPVTYQPCGISDITYTEEILANVEANGYNVKATHFLAKADTTTITSGDDVYIRIEAPANDIARSYAASKVKNSKDLIFEVREDSVLTIAVDKQSTELTGEVTAIGPVNIMFYGKGRPYGEVKFGNDTVFCAGDTIHATVTLHQGIAEQIQNDNKIVVYVAKAIANDNTYVPSNDIIATTEVNAKYADTYNIGMKLPDSIKGGNDDKYFIFVGSLKYNEGFELLSNRIITIKGEDATAIANTTASNSAKSSSSIYNIAGQKVKSKSQAGKVYIKNGRKYLKK